MSKKQDEDPQDERASRHSQQPAGKPKGGADMVYTVKHDPNTEDEQRNAEEREYWKKQLFQAKILNVITGLGATVAGLALAGLVWNAILVHDQVVEMQTANRISMGAFEATERPWLSVQVSPGGNGLYFVNGQQAALTINILIRNVGRSIAKNIQVNAGLFPSPPGLPIATNASENQRKLCDHPQLTAVGAFSLFPTDPPADWSTTVSAIPKVIDTQAVTLPGAKPRRFVGLYVVGCVTYLSSFGPNIYQSRFAYHLTGPPIVAPDRRFLFLPNGMPIVMAFEMGRDIPKGKIQLAWELFASNDSY
ncbi:MAG TPA: hypothetical protein VGS20_07150 [Candidatus Acidoferrales bacterium]|nr:hypothetical protein [Candidatus Acidoferrales bacterium]